MDLEEVDDTTSENDEDDNISFGKAASPQTDKVEAVSTILVARPVGAHFALMANVPGAVPSTEYELYHMNSGPPLVTHVDLNINLNGFCHKTWMYSHMKKKKPQLVVRRGQPFRIAVTLSNELGSTDTVKITLYTKDRFSTPLEENTYFELTPPRAHFMLLEKGRWSSVWDFISPNGKILYVQVLPSQDCVIGKWFMEVHVENEVTSNVVPWKTEEPFYVLFNAWNKNDESFITEYSRRHEYILKEYGKIFRGIHNSTTTSFWKYAQFDDAVLDFALEAMTDFGQKKLSECGSLARVTKSLAASIKPILVEKDAANSDINSPEWAGTLPLIEEYLRVQSPVMFVQPHVAPAVTVSCLRALGVASRNVTCYNWGHQTLDHFNTVDMIYTNNRFADVTAQKECPIACYFVFTEVWYKGSYANQDFTGWAGVTSTNGPFPMEFIRKELDEDTYGDHNFFSGGFNSRCIIWKYFGHNLPIKMVSIELDRVGKLVATKEIRTWKIEDITPNYKLQKLTPKDEELEVIKNYTRLEPMFQNYYVNDPFKEVNYKLIVNKSYRIDENIVITLLFHNHSRKWSYNLEIRLMVTSIMGNGGYAHTIKDERKVLTLDPHSAKRYTVEVLPVDYFHKLTDENLFKVVGQVYVRESTYDFFSYEFFRVILPQLKISLQPFPKVNARNVIEISFTNNTQETISEALLSLEELDGKRSRSVRKLNITPLSLSRVQFSLLPQKKGIYHLTAMVSTKYWKNITYTILHVDST